MVMAAAVGVFNMNFKYQSELLELNKITGHDRKLVSCAIFARKKTRWFWTYKVICH